MRGLLIGVLIIFCLISSTNALSLGISKPYMNDNTVFANTGENIFEKRSINQIVNEALCSESVMQVDNQLKLFDF